MPILSYDTARNRKTLMKHDRKPRAIRLRGLGGRPRDLLRAIDATDDLQALRDLITSVILDRVDLEILEGDDETELDSRITFTAEQRSVIAMVEAHGYRVKPIKGVK